MNSMTIEKAAAVCGGKIYGSGDLNAPIGRAVIDSRLIEKGDMFVAYRGERTDGHAYISKALDSGAACALAERVPGGETRPVIVVDDVQKALERIAAAYRQTLNIPVVGITGSVGKTSAKEMVWSVMSRAFNTLKTEGNLNNQIGVPMTLSSIERSHQAAVVEMGISGFGEMRLLSEMVRPTIGVFTVIGHAHLEFLHDLDGVLKAKTEMLELMDDTGTVIMNGDDEKLRGFKCRQRKLTFGIEKPCDIMAENIVSEGSEGTRCTITYEGRRLDVYIPAYGKHLVYAALAAAGVGFTLGMSDEQIIAGIGDFQIVGRRGAVITTDYLTLIDDCYNANPDSVKCGIDSLMKTNGRRVCILSDMLELGENSPEMHHAVGKYAAEKGVDLIICTGPLSKYTCDGAGEQGVYFENRSELIANLHWLINRGDTVLVKASHGMKLEEISEELKRL